MLYQPPTLILSQGDTLEKLAYTYMRVRELDDSQDGYTYAELLKRRIESADLVLDATATLLDIVSEAGSKLGFVVIGGGKWLQVNTAKIHYHPIHGLWLSYSRLITKGCKHLNGEASSGNWAWLRFDAEGSTPVLLYDPLNDAGKDLEPYVSPATWG